MERAREYVSVNGSIYKIADIVKEYQSNGYDQEKIARLAEQLSKERREAGNQEEENNEKNWIDAERLVAVHHFLKDSS